MKQRGEKGAVKIKVSLGRREDRLWWVKESGFKYTFLFGVSIVDGNHIMGVMVNLGPVVILFALRKRNNGNHTVSGY